MADGNHFYPALRTESTIRILTLHAGGGINRLSCSTASVPITEAPAYIALSYTWGTGSDLVGIELNGRPFPLRQNLWHFLHKLRQPHYDIVLWCDMLCINQDDPAERGHQVRLMGDVYRTASQVSVWLGREADRSAEVFEYLRYIENAEDDISRHSERISWQSYDSAVESTSKIDNIRSQDRRFRKRMNAAVLSLLHRDYWERVWIIQEVTHAKEAIVHCGEESMEWTSFWRALSRSVGLFAITAEALEDHKRRWSQNPNAWAYKWQCWRYRGELESWAGFEASSAQAIRRHKPGHKEDFGDYKDLLGTLKRARCTDVRDKVFGVRDIVDDLRHLNIDYTKSTAELFVDALQGMRLPLSGYRQTVVDFAEMISVGRTALRQAILDSSDPGIKTSQKYIFEVRPHHSVVRTQYTTNNQVMVKLGMLHLSRKKKIKWHNTSWVRVTQNEHSQRLANGDLAFSLSRCGEGGLGLLGDDGLSDKDIICFTNPEVQKHKLLLLPPIKPFHVSSPTEAQKIDDLNAAFASLWLTVIRWGRTVNLNRLQYLHLMTVDLYTSNGAD